MKSQVKKEKKGYDQEWELKELPEQGGWQTNGGAGTTVVVMVGEQRSVWVLK